MDDIRVTIPNGVIEGTCDARFRGVADEFERGFRERGEVGGSVCVHHEGRTVVDLWGGMANPAHGTPWARDTVSIVFSCTKGATAICAHMLASRGLLDLDAPVAEYWPEFVRNGKTDATVRMMLDHSVGLPVCRTFVKAGGFHEWDYMVELLADQEPYWKPGTRHGYHMVNFGWTVGELIRRVSGRSLGTFFREEIADPLGIDFWIGMPEEHESRVAPIITYLPEPGEPLGAFVEALLASPQSLQALSLLNVGGFDPNSREAHAAEIGGAGGISNARGLAGMYAPLASGGASEGVRLVDSRQLALMGEVSMATYEDATLLIPTRFALGFMKSMDNRRRVAGDRDSVLLSSAAFGHVGAGGSIGFADPHEGLAFGYSMNRMGRGLLLNDRGQSLVDATYRALGYASNDAGVWRKER
jgi:CubicO group peptidase (beta-lactamase class C family)